MCVCVFSYDCQLVQGEHTRNESRTLSSAAIVVWRGSNKLFEETIGFYQVMFVLVHLEDVDMNVNRKMLLNIWLPPLPCGATHWLLWLTPSTWASKICDSGAGLDQSLFCNPEEDKA